MFNRWLCLAFVAMLGLPAQAQRFGYVDTQVILEKMPEYAQAQSELEKQAEIWRKEIEEKQAAVQKMRLDFEAEKVLLPEDLRQQRLAAIDAKEKEVMDFQNKIFGIEGQIYQKRLELMKPIQDKVYAAVEKVARKRRLSFIFDKAGDLVMIFADPIHNYTDIVMEELGIADANSGTTTPNNKSNNGKKSNN
ncbi:MAG: OmpH family outer membrane protein [Cytophagales bacterium]|nr:OmpH family outer membrane protein [Bernardetiaceae bacterium]MDW8204745.1 OmpH family outer membrane protein [Cytophagales bacterium]